MRSTTKQSQIMLFLVGRGISISISFLTGSKNLKSTGSINILISPFRQVKKEINDAVKYWSMRNLIDFRLHAQYCSFPPVRPAKFQPPGMPITCRFFDWQQFGDLIGLN
jgi:hypothetical protein